MPRHHCNKRSSSRDCDFTSSCSDTATFVLPCNNKCPPYVTSCLPSDAIPDNSSEVSCSETSECRDPCRPRRPCYPDPCYRPRYNDCDMSCTFLAMITPLNNIRAVYSTDHNGMVRFVFRRKNKVVTLQWEPFTATVGANGAAAMIINQSISGMPSYPLDLPVSITYAGVAQMTVMTVDPHTNEQLKIYFHLDKSSNEVKIGDSISVPGACVSWISCD